MRVLLIDDCEDTNLLLSRLLGRLTGFDVRTVEDPRLALSVAADFRPDAICMDIAMPSMDGYALAHAIRQVAGLEEVVIIALSGYVVDGARAKAAGIDAHFLKPGDSRLIGDTILDAVKARAAAAGN